MTLCSSQAFLSSETSAPVINMESFNKFFAAPCCNISDFLFIFLLESANITPEAPAEQYLNVCQRNSLGVLSFRPVLRFRMMDPYVFGPPGTRSGSINTRYGSGSGSGSRILLSSTKNSKKNFDSYCFMTSL
jgi:hypothetical protein